MFYSFTYAIKLRDVLRKVDEEFSRKYSSWDLLKIKNVVLWHKGMFVTTMPYDLNYLLVSFGVWTNFFF